MKGWTRMFNKADIIKPTMEERNLLGQIVPIELICEDDLKDIASESENKVTTDDFHYVIDPFYNREEQKRAEMEQRQPDYYCYLMDGYTARMEDENDDIHEMTTFHACDALFGVGENMPPFVTIIVKDEAQCHAYPSISEFDAKCRKVGLKWEDCKI